MILYVRGLQRLFLKQKYNLFSQKFYISNINKNNPPLKQRMLDENPKQQISQILKQQEEDLDNKNTNIIKAQPGQLIEKTYEQIQIDSFKQRNFSNLTQLQKQIIKSNQFDLTNPQITPRMTSINSFKGINATLTEIDLGKVKIKNKDQVFLSQIDPYNIPQDYQIKFDKQKILTIVGKQVSQNTVLAETQNKKMTISTHQSFQEKSLSQIRQKFLGVNFKYQYNRKQSFRSWILSFILFYLIGYPIVDTLKEYYICAQSIKSIQLQYMSEVQKVKKKNMIKALLQNQDFNRIL